VPIYDYRCTKGHIFEVMGSVNDEPLDKCEVCGSPAQRLLYPPAVHFKGSGFYHTDYGKRKRSRAEKGESSSSESSSSESSGESKPAAEPTKPAAKD